MDRRDYREPSRGEKFVQWLGIAIAAISAGISLAEKIQRLSQDPYKAIEDLLRRLGSVETQLKNAQRKMLLDPETHDRLSNDLSKSVTVLLSGIPSRSIPAHPRLASATRQRGRPGI
jgi:hypothetical protein